MEEVAPVEIYTIQRPLLLPAAVCAPSASWLPIIPRVAVITALRPAPAPRAYQVLSQAELAQAQVLAYGSNGIDGFKGRSGSAKHMTDGASGVPPRGRPV